MHVYHRALGSDGSDSLDLVRERIRPSSEVLDVGTGTGALGAALKIELGCTLDGVTNNQQEASIARTAYRDLVVADIEQTSIGDLFSGRQYDHIVFADVLEHLREPELTLKGAIGLLRPTGTVLISVPNVSYAGVVADLIAGRFEYTAEGLLDRTHVRFFTRHSLEQFLRISGFAPTYWNRVVKQLGSSEFAHRYPDQLPPPLAKAIMTASDSLTYQFIVEARPETAPNVALAPSPKLPVPEHCFSVQVYWNYQGAPFREENSSVGLGKIGCSRQTVTLPIRGDGKLGLRLDPADREGTMWLLDVRLVDESGKITWQWDGTPGALSEGNGFVALPSAIDAKGAVLGIFTGDPHIVLSRDLDVGPKSRLEVDLSWPASSDSLALSRAHQSWTREVEEGYRQALGESKRQAKDLDAALGERDQHIRELRSQLASVISQLASVTSQLEATQSEMDEIKGSRSWRYAESLRRLRVRQ